MDRKVHELRQVRGVILGTLRDYYPNGLSAWNLFASCVQPLFPGAEWGDVVGALVYLRDRGFIEPVSSRGPATGHSFKRAIFRLTPAGVDVAAGVNEDDGVLVEQADG